VASQCFGNILPTCTDTIKFLCTDTRSKVKRSTKITYWKDNSANTGFLLLLSFLQIEESSCPIPKMAKEIVLLLLHCPRGEIILTVLKKEKNV